MDLEELKTLPPWEWPAGTDRALLEALRGPSDAERAIAVELAGDSTVVNDQLVDALLAVATDARHAPELRARACIAFGPALELGDTDGFEDPYGAPISEAAFGRIQKILRELHRDPAAPELVRRRALEASVRAVEDWHKTAVREEYDSGAPDRRLTAVFCMQYVPGFEKEIVEALESKDDQILFQAVVAAGEREIAKAWRHIKPLLDEKTGKELLLAAIAAAAGVAPKQARAQLLDLAESDDDEVAEAARDALGMAPAGDLDED